ncbi:hypothetical protein HMPREF9248_0943 [Fannyhessea vaginae PB189-T1-4]|uniref:Uncharacterized protein n=1 Tax=Fannyhessea vaginae PB189-T1-4 TaxID=866774 RepID=A0ABN0B0B8_9ACTN|nr:hypothetical protein HMPREF9248_0943 [Fannyhessea vaginae PB189-T1-4]
MQLKYSVFCVTIMRKSTMWLFRIRRTHVPLVQPNNTSCTSSVRHMALYVI